MNEHHGQEDEDGQQVLGQREEHGGESGSTTRGKTTLFRNDPLPVTASVALDAAPREEGP
jgi:hypothetical protein